MHDAQRSPFEARMHLDVARVPNVSASFCLFAVHLLPSCPRAVGRREGIRRESVGENAQDHRADDRHGQSFVMREVLIQHNDNEYDAGQSSRTEPSDEQFALQLQASACQGKQYGHHPHDGQAEDGIGDDPPVEMFDRAPHNRNTKSDLGEQSEYTTGSFGSSKKLLFVVFDQSPKQQTADE